MADIRISRVEGRNQGKRAHERSLRKYRSKKGRKKEKKAAHITIKEEHKEE